jgi:hypothetical protein
VNIQKGNTEDPENVFVFGCFAGFMLIFVFILLFLRYDGYIDPNSNAVFNKVFPCFRYFTIENNRGMALFLTYYWFLAIDVALYNYFGVNYKVFLGFNHHFSTLGEIVKRASVLTIIYLLIFIIYILQ